MIYNIILHIFRRESLPWWLSRNKILCNEISYGEYPEARSGEQSLATSQQESEILRLEDYEELRTANKHVSLEVWILL